MTPDEYKNNLNFDAKFERIKIAYLLSVKDVIGAQVVRIFEEGKDSSGGLIGVYEYTGKNKAGKSVGIYVPDNKSPRNGTKKGKTGKTITTTYYESYQSFRSEQGRESSFVNLRLFGRLMSDLANAPVNEQRASLTSEAEPIKLDDFEYFTRIRSENVGKKKGADAKYGSVFLHTQAEKERFRLTLEDELKMANA